MNLLVAYDISTETKAGEKRLRRGKVVNLGKEVGIDYDEPMIL